MKQITKLFLTLFLWGNLASANEQLVLIVSNDFNQTHGELTRYDKVNHHYQLVGQAHTVNLGRNGLAWGLGLYNFKTKPTEPVKREGDGKAPAGVFNITTAFGYDETAPTKMPYIQADKTLICVDDSLSKNYNKIVELNPTKKPKSFEWMKREDNLYQYGLVIAHNTQAKKQAGSCIFFHIRKSKDAPTAGCSAMKEEELLTLLKWLDPTKKPQVVQIPRSYCSQAQDLYPGIICP